MPSLPIGYRIFGFLALIISSGLGCPCGPCGFCEIFLQLLLGTNLDIWGGTGRLPPQTIDERWNLHADWYTVLLCALMQIVPLFLSGVFLLSNNTIYWSLAPITLTISAIGLLLSLIFAICCNYEQSQLSLLLIVAILCLLFIASELTCAIKLKQRLDE